MTPLYIFDLDGTLAKIEHRRHFVENGARRWKEFFAACIDDEPNVPVIKTLKRLVRGGSEVRIWSGRSDEVQTETRKWLNVHVFGRYIWEPMLRMRKAGDYTPDNVLKERWLDEMEPEDRARLVAVFDDRDRLVKMYRDRGVACFQVAPGDF